MSQKVSGGKSRFQKVSEGLRGSLRSLKVSECLRKSLEVTEGLRMS